MYREIYASLCRKAGRPEEAVKAYETIGAQGEQSRIQKKKAFTLAKSGRELEALPLLEELLKNEPADKYLHSSYAAACRRNSSSMPTTTASPGSTRAAISWSTWRRSAGAPAAITTPSA